MYVFLNKVKMQTGQKAFILWCKYVLTRIIRFCQSSSYGDLKRSTLHWRNGMYSIRLCIRLILYIILLESVNSLIQQLTIHIT